MQKFVCLFLVQMQDEKRHVGNRRMKAYLREAVVVELDVEDAGMAPKSAGEDATVCLAADIENLVPVAQEITEPLTMEQIRQLADKNGRIKVVVPIPFGKVACMSYDGTYEGLNNYMDEKVFGKVSGVGADYCYKPVYVQGDKVMVEFTADASMILDNMD